MPLDSVAEGYAQTLFLTRMEDLAKTYRRRMAETGAELSKSGMSGHYHTELTRIGIDHIKELVDARVDSLLAAYERSELPIDHQAVEHINRVAVEYCDAQGKYLASGAQERAARSGAPPGVAEALAATIASAISGIKARVNRKLSALRDEQILAARSASRRGATAPQPMASDPQGEKITDESKDPAAGIVVRVWRNSAKWQWFTALFLGACTFISLQEYFLSIPLLLLSAISLLSKVTHSKHRLIFRSLEVLGIGLGFALFLFIVVAIKGPSPWSHIQAPLTAFFGIGSRTPPQAPTTPAHAPSDPFRIVIKYIRTDWGHKYEPRTLFMAYYFLNNSPKLSPIDLWVDLRIINLQSTSTTIEAWSIETGPTPEGPWMRLTHIPSSPHLAIYLVGSLRNSKSRAILFPDLEDSLLKSIPPQEEINGWALCECPSNPPCLGWYQRIKVRDTQGRDYFQIISLSDYNAALADDTAGIDLTLSKAPPIDLTNIDVLRPFPKNAHRVEPTNEGETAHLFGHESAGGPPLRSPVSPP